MPIPFFNNVKFNLIRNRSFLSHQISSLGTPAKVVNDLKRNKESISIDGETLKDIFIREFNIDTADKDLEAINQEIDRHLSADDDESEESIKHILAIYKKTLFKRIEDEGKKEELAKKLSSMTYQKGILWALSNSVAEDAVVADKGYFPKTETRISFHTTDNGFYVDEECKVMSINDSNIQAPHGKPMYAHANDDNSPMMILKNRFHLFVDEGTLKYAHTDLTIEYNSTLCEDLYDRRTLLEKIRDFFKALFMMNDIEEFSIKNSTISPSNEI